MNGVVLGFEIAAGILLFLVVVRVLSSFWTRGFLGGLDFHGWAENHPTADTILFFATALTIVAGIALWLKMGQHH